MAATLDHGTVHSFLRGLWCPLGGEELVRPATANRAPERLIRALREMSRSRYGSQQEVMEQLQARDHNIEE